VIEGFRNKLISFHFQASCTILLGVLGTWTYITEWKYVIDLFLILGESPGFDDQIIFEAARTMDKALSPGTCTTNFIKCIMY
jgi:hypothetical protein